MPANTPNRGYPYSIPTDPADVPGALQSLAEAIDTDLVSVDATITPKPFCQVRGTLFQSVPPGGVVTMEYDFVDYDNDQMANLGTAPTQILPTTPGTYWIYTEILCPQQFSPSTDPVQDFTLRANGADQSRRIRVEDSGSPGLLRVSCEIAMLITGVGASDTPITVTFTHNALTPLLILERKLGALRVGN